MYREDGVYVCSVQDASYVLVLGGHKVPWDLGVWKLHLVKCCQATYMGKDHCCSSAVFVV